MGVARKADLHYFYDWLRRLGRTPNGKTAATSPPLFRYRLDGPARSKDRARQPDPDHRIRDSDRLRRPENGAAASRRKTSLMLERKDRHLLFCDRERAVVWGIEGGLPSIPHGLTLQRAGSDEEEWLGAIFSDVPIGAGDSFSRPTAGGGGFGDPLQRDPALVLEDVIDDYVSIERAAMDYGVVIKAIDAEICSYEIDEAATERSVKRSPVLRQGGSPHSGGGRGYLSRRYHR